MNTFLIWLLYIVIVSCSFFFFRKKVFLFSLLSILIIPWLLFLPFNIILVDLDIDGIIYIEVSLLVFIVSYIFGYGALLNSRPCIFKYPEEFLFFKFIFITTIIIGLINNLYLLNASGGGGSLESFFRSAHIFSQMRYEQGYKMPYFVRFSSIYVFFGFFVVTMHFFKKSLVDGKKKLKYILPIIIIIIIQTIITGIKGYILYMLFYYIASFLIVYKSNFSLCRSKRVLPEFLLIFLCVFVVSIFALLLKRNFNATLVGMLLKLFTSYFFLPSSAFILWFNENYLSNLLNMELFKNTFLGISVYMQNLPYDVKHQDYTDVLLLGGAFHTNVYPLFKSIVLDFGVYGSLLLTVVVGFLSGVVERMTLSGSRIVIPLYMVLALFFLNFTFGSWFKYMSNIAVFFMITMYFVLLSYKYSFFGKKNT